MMLVELVNNRWIQALVIALLSIQTAGAQSQFMEGHTYFNIASQETEQLPQGLALERQQEGSEPSESTESESETSEEKAKEPVEEKEVEPEEEEKEELEKFYYPGEPRELEGEFGDGFALVSEDEEFELMFHVLNQVDYKFFSPGDQEPAAISGIYIPRMRVYLEGKLTDPFRYEVSLQRSVEGQFDLLDANLDIAFSEGLQIRFGRTLIPYSYTWYDHLEQYFIVPERPLFPLNFGLSRAAGIQLWGEDELRRWQYSLGGYDGRAAGLADDSTTTDFVSYLNLRPFVVRRAGGLLENFNIGGSLVLGKFRRPAELLPGRTSVQSSENDEAAVAASAVFYEFEPDVVGLGDRLVGAIHAAWYVGPVSVEAEWNALNVDVLNEATEERLSLTANGFHVTLASFITGERVRGREVVQPLRPFDPRFGCSHLGAFEPFVRYSYLKLDEEAFEREFIDPDLWTDEASMVDLGVNWYLNRYTKFYFDWQHVAYSSPVLVNENRGEFRNSNDLFWIRCQFYF